MARAALGWSLDDLAAATGLNRKTILRFERHEASPRASTLQALRSALEGAGVRFGDEGSVLPSSREPGGPLTAQGELRSCLTAATPEVSSSWSLSGTTKDRVEEEVLEDPVLRPEQSRMARAALQWSLEDSAEAAGISRRSVLRFECDHRDIKPELIQALRRAFEEAGIRFIEEASRIGVTAPLGPSRP